jgi:excisionase family DNA binding protein
LKGGDKMLTKQELAEILKVTVPTIDRYMKDGMPYMKFATGKVRFEIEEVKKWAYEKKGE